MGSEPKKCYISEIIKHFLTLDNRLRDMNQPSSNISYSKKNHFYYNVAKSKKSSLESILNILK